MGDEKNGFDSNLLALPFILGGVVGAALVILYAPWEGHQTRSKLKEMATEVKEKSNQITNNWKEKAACFLEKRKEVKETNGEVLPSDFEAVNNDSATVKEPLISPEEA